MTLSKTQSIQGQTPNMLGFLEWLSQRKGGEFIQLFEGTGQALEKELMVYQTIRASLKNYRSTGQLSSKVDLAPGHSNFKAFNWLVTNKYLAIDGDRCTLTYLATAKLYVHFAAELQVLPIALPQ